MSKPAIREASPADGAALAAIYAPYVENTAISFEEAAPGADAMAMRIADQHADLPWLVAEAGGDILGYAYAAPYHPRAAYRYTIETTVYVGDAARGRGIGRDLYRALLERLDGGGLHMAVALIALPNPASVALHAATGFSSAGILREVGFKFGAWHDVGFWQRPLGGEAASLGRPRG